MSHFDQNKHIDTRSQLQISSYKRFTEEARLYILRYSTITMRSLFQKFMSYRSPPIRNRILDQMRLEWQIQYNNSPLQTEDEVKDKISLAKLVVGFYLHQINPDTKTRDHILHDEAFELTNLLEGGEPDPKRFATLITAATQSGKTFLAIALVNIMLALGYVPCFVVMNLKQKSQLYKRYINDTLELKNFLLTEGFFGDQLDIFEEPIFYDSSSHNTFDEDIQACLNGSARRAIICIHHEKHLQNVLSHMTPESRLVVFIDEAHKLGGYKNLSSSGLGDDLHGSTKYETALQEIKTHAIKIFLITATPQDILLSDPTLYAYGIVYIPEGTKYRGIICWQFDLIEHTKVSDEEIHAEVNDDGKRKIIGIPKPFMKWMKKLSNEDPIKRTDKFGRRGYHPINVLARYQPINELQQMTLSSFRSDTKPANDEHQEIIDAEWAAMVFNQYGIRLFHESLRGQTITIGNETIVDMLGNGEFLFKNADLGDVWQWLAHNGGVERFPRLITIAYHNASEGISYCSTWTDEPDTDVSWHITHGYIRLGHGASSAAMEQAMGRLNGNYGDDIIPTIMCTLDEKERCIKGHLLHYKWIKALANLALFNKDVRVIDYITRDPLFTNHIPRAFSSIPKAIKQLKRKSNPHKDIEDETFKRHRNARSTMQILAPEHFDVEEKRRKRNIDRVEQDNSDNSDDSDNSQTFEIFISKTDLPNTHHDLYDMAVSLLKKKKNMWVKKAAIFTSQQDQNLTWHWSKYSKSDGSKGLFMRKEKNNYEFKYI